MKKVKIFIALAAMLVAVGACAVCLTACGSNYNSYASRYDKLTSRCESVEKDYTNGKTNAISAMAELSKISSDAVVLANDISKDDSLTSDEQTKLGEKAANYLVAYSKAMATISGGSLLS